MHTFLFWLGFYIASVLISRLSIKLFEEKYDVPAAYYACLIPLLNLPFILFAISFYVGRFFIFIRLSDLLILLMKYIVIAWRYITKHTNFWSWFTNGTNKSVWDEESKTS